MYRFSMNINVHFFGINTQECNCWFKQYVHVSFYKKLPNFFRVTVPFYIVTNTLMMHFCIFTSIWYYHYFSHPERYVVISHCGFNLHFLMSGDIIHLFVWLFAFSKKAREFQKNICLIDYTKAFNCVDHNKMWKILKEMEMPDHLTCLLRNMYAGWEAAVRTRHGTTDLFQTGKGVCQSCILSPCIFNLYAEYIMWNAGLDEA